MIFINTILQPDGIWEKNCSEVLFAIFNIVFPLIGYKNASNIGIEDIVESEFDSLSIISKILWSSSSRLLQSQIEVL